MSQCINCMMDRPWTRRLYFEVPRISRRTSKHLKMICQHQVWTLENPNGEKATVGNVNVDLESPIEKAISVLNDLIKRSCLYSLQTVAYKSSMFPIVFFLLF